MRIRLFIFPVMYYLILVFIVIHADGIYASAEVIQGAESRLEAVQDLWTSPTYPSMFMVKDYEWEFPLTPEADSKDMNLLLNDQAFLELLVYLSRQDSTEVNAFLTQTLERDIAVQVPAFQDAFARYLDRYHGAPGNVWVSVPVKGPFRQISEQRTRILALALIQAMLDLDVPIDILSRLVMQADEELQCVSAHPDSKSQYWLIESYSIYDRAILANAMLKAYAANSPPTIEPVRLAVWRILRHPKGALFALSPERSAHGGYFSNWEVVMEAELVGAVSEEEFDALCEDLLGDDSPQPTAIAQ